jgi:hypothetical protein
VDIFPPSFQHRPADLTGRTACVGYQELFLSALVLSAAIASNDCRHSRNMRSAPSLFQMEKGQAHAGGAAPFC